MGKPNNLQRNHIYLTEDIENQNTVVATNEAESKAALIGHVSFSINFWTCMCSAPTLCHGPTFLVESTAISAMWTFQESSPEAHCVQAGQESAPTFWYFFLGQTATSKSNSATVSKHLATCPSRS
ncbi:hypothetical protein T4B_3315 [Trichinella pseudospiralis]|uniref:Uncharacterized protein n=3 Tax=Trichinella pseudospiralis TaxID=6337 RepID=A0A0V1E919_TRIPS|nr:hypothetical protein T4A_3499 [Trichinella pseudospiralis]KRZ06805.1 hypothetical protein T4B_3315 [Trichinella pseudospiralis]